MKITVLQENLHEALSFLSKTFPSRSVTPGSGTVTIQAQKDKIEAFAADPELSVALQIMGKTEEEGVVVVALETLQPLIGSMAGEKITLRTEGQGFFVEGKRSKSELRTEPEADGGTRAEKPEKNETATLSIQTAGLIEARKRVAFSASSDQARAALTGVLFDGTQSPAIVVATDGFRLSYLKTKKASMGAGKVVVPAKTLSLLESAAKGAETGKVWVSKDSSVVRVVYSSASIQFKTIGGSYPEFEKIIPKETDTKTVVGREDLLGAIKTASVFSKDNSNIVRLTFGKDKVVVSADSPQAGKNETTLDAEVKGEGLSVAFNHRFLFDVLSSLDDCARVVIETRGSLQPVTFTGEGLSDYFHIVMPVRIQG